MPESRNPGERRARSERQPHDLADVDAGLQAEASREDLKRRARALSGRFRSGVSDLSTEHDRYLEEAFGD